MTRPDAISRVAYDLDCGLDWQEAIDGLVNGAGYEMPEDVDLALEEAVSIVRAAERQLGWS